MSPTSGYSGTPLAKKLGITAGMRVCVQAAPADYTQWLAPLPDGVVFDAEATRISDLVHLFCTEQSKLSVLLKQLRGGLRPEVAVWVSWPKRASKQPTDITEDVIRALALPLGFVDIKVCAVSEVWSGLKLVVRKELR